MKFAWRSLAVYYKEEQEEAKGVEKTVEQIKETGPHLKEQGSSTIVTSSINGIHVFGGNRVTMAVEFARHDMRMRRPITLREQSSLLMAARHWFNRT